MLTYEQMFKCSHIIERNDKMADSKHAQVCDAHIVHESIVEKVKGMMPGDEAIYDLADLFKMFGDTTRMKILYVLLESEMCVCDIAEILGMTQSAISHQLRLLKSSKLIANRREGKSIIYFLADEHVRSIINQGMEHVGE